MALKYTFEQALFLSRVANGDVAAIPDLWSTLTDRPLDAKRPAEDIVNDLAEMLKPYNPEPEQKATKTEKEVNKELFEEAWKIGQLVGELLTKPVDKRP